MAQRINWMTGDEISGWTLSEHLGSGGKAEVWKVQAGDGTEAALKTLLRKQVNSEPYRRFQTEIAVLRSLTPYPGVLPLIESELPDSPSRSKPAWIAMPLAIPVRKALGKQ